MKIIELTATNLKNLLKRPVSDSKEILAKVEKIVDDVRKLGDKALIEYTALFDKVKLSPQNLRVEKEKIEQATKIVSAPLLAALKLAIERIRNYHQKQSQDSWFISQEPLLGQKVTPLERVGIYVPGGRADYPSSVLMNAIPAQVAGVQEIALCVPPNSSEEVSAPVLAAASLLSIEEVYRIGGAQAIAALAYGTKTIPRVDKITGPGNIYVTLAKKLVVGDVGIDMIAGPSEILILADESANPQFIAADMLAQAEHDPLALVLLITTSEEIAVKTKKALQDRLPKTKRLKIASAALENNGKLLFTQDLKLALEFVNTFAPEHLEILTSDPAALLPKIKNAGAIFLGEYTPEALGDYIAGPNHILPTGGTARFYSPLGVCDFLKKSSVLSFSKKKMSEIAQAAVTLAEAEGLQAHAQSLKVRLADEKN